ncbi:hypothetical protein [Kribbella sp. NPDC000426]|uniref:hypothetical protein n=1 Tax=Kribbella sp. NPDC000426 TaxID=3154255 RepID=UPI00331830AA
MNLRRMTMRRGAVAAMGIAMLGGMTVATPAQAGPAAEPTPTAWPRQLSPP